MSILYYITKHLQSHGCAVELYLPYVPNARMDRVKHGDEIFTLKYFSEFINSLGFNKVHITDPHSNVVCALLNSVQAHTAFSYLHRVILGLNDDNLVMMYPDEGAMKRYSELTMESHPMPYAFGIKNRDWRSGDIKELILMNRDFVNGKNVLIVDDICSKGGTFYYAAKALKEAGACDIYLYITHCENTIHQGELLNSDLIKHIFTTNSILTTPHAKITVLI